MVNPKDFDSLEEFLAAVIAEAMQSWANSGKPMPEPQHGGGGGP